MAGIGFKLREVMKKKLLVFDVGAILYAVLTTSGPWLISSAYMLIVSKFSNVDIFFTSSLIYAFIFSMIISGGLSFLIIRYAADAFYRKDLEAVRKAYGGSLLFVASISASISGIFFLVHHCYSAPNIILSIYSLTALSVLWVQMIFVSVSERFLPVILSYLAGFSLSLTLSLVLRAHHLFFFDIGIGLTVFLQNNFIVKVIGFPEGISMDFLRIFRTYPQNLFIGLGYYTAVWADDLLAWFLMGREVLPGFRFAVDYDIPMFLAYLFVIPSLSMFVFLVETEFYTEYKRFYLKLEKGAGLWEIKSQAERMRESVYYSIGSIAAVQIAAAFVGISMSETLKKLGLSAVAAGVFKWGLVGASFNVMFLTILLITLYFDFRDLALQGVIVSFVCNILFSVLTMKFHPGMGFAMALGVAFVYLAVRLRARLNEVIMYTFTHMKSGLEKSVPMVVKNREIK